MIHSILKDKPTKLFLGITAFFVANALIAECIGGKIFSLEKVFGLAPSNFTLFGVPNLSFNLTCGVLLWPLEFVITDIVNEYFGPKAVRRISYTAVALISYAFLMFYLAMRVAPAQFWVESRTADGIPSMQLAFESIFGQGMWIGEKMIWLRATGSTVVSQLVDSFVVLFIAFKIGNGWSWSTVLAVGVVNYIYKFTMAIILTPLIAFIQGRIENYLGHDLAKKMKLQAMGLENEA